MDRDVEVTLVFRGLQNGDCFQPFRRAACKKRSKIFLWRIVAISWRSMTRPACLRLAKASARPFPTPVGLVARISREREGIDGIRIAGRRRSGALAAEIPDLDRNPGEI